MALQLLLRVQEGLEMERSRNCRIAKMIQRLIFAICVCLPATAQQMPQQEINGVYLGTLGKEKIVAEIGVGQVDPVTKGRYTSPHITGRYFHRQTGRPIELEGIPVGENAVWLQEYRDGEPTRFEWWLRVEDGKATGWFCQCSLTGASAFSREAIEVSLTRVSEGFDPDFSWYEGREKAADKAFYDLLLDFPLETRTTMQISSDITYVIQRDPRFEVTVVQLTQFPDLKVLARVNNDLRYNFDQNRLFAAECGSDTDCSVEGSDSVTFFTRDVLSVLENTLSFTGGAHPNAEVTARIYNLHTGQPIVLDKEIDVARLKGDIAKPQTTKYFYPDQAKVDLVDSWLVDLYLSNYRKAHNGPELCEDAAPGSERERMRVALGPVWLSNAGLVISTLNSDLPHAFQGCGPEVNVPYGQVIPFLKKDSILRSALQP